MRGLFENAPPLPPNATQQQRDQRTTTLRRGILEGQNQFGLPMDTGLLTYQPRQLVGNITVGSPESQQLKSYYAVQEDRAGKLFEEIGKRQARYAPLKESVRILEESLDNVTAGVGPAAKLLGRALTLGGVSQDTISELGLGDVGSTELFTARSQQGAVQLMAAIGQALGPYSDKDLSIFIKSMPSLWNTKEGNRLILTFLSYSIRKAEAADRFVDDYWNDNKVTPSIGQIEDFKNQYDQKNRPKVLVNSQESIDKASQSEPAWTTTREADSLPPGADYISEYRNAAGARVIIYKLGDKQYRATEQQP